MNITATEFKARCLALIDRAARGEEVRISKRGKVVARLVPDWDGSERPWLVLRESRAEWRADPTAAAISEEDVEALS